MSNSEPATFVLLNGRVCVDGCVAIASDDPALVLGITVFETMRTYHRTPFRLDEHVGRLARSAAWMGVPMPRADLLADEVRQAVSAIPGCEVEVRVTLTPTGHRIVRGRRVASPPAVLRCATRPHAPLSAIPGWVKHGSRADWVMAVQRSGADEVLWVDREGMLLEGTRSNVFAVVGGTLCTPPLDGRILAGVTRGALLDAARAVGVPISEAPLPAAGPFDELYLSSTLKELVAVIELDGSTAAGNGPVGRAVSRGFAEATRAG